ncbi:MAG: hypothetical protein H7Z41_01630 [Cytophagales bacterium]|nr:hypothetical protein [Armatimonadota bacterium]
MTHAEAYDLLGPFVDGDLPDETRRRLESLLFADRDLAWEAQTLALTRARLREGMGEVVASDAFRARALARLHRDNPHLAAASAAAEEPTQYQLPIQV